METKIECPLGSECVTNTGKSTRTVCAWRVKVVGTDAQGNEHDEWGCAIAWLPILMLENSKNIRSTAAATESMRNEVVKRQDFLNGMLRDAQRVKEIE